MTVFSPFIYFFRQNDPRKSKYKNAQFLQSIMNDDDVYLKKPRSILNLREFFRSDEYRVLHNMLQWSYGVTRQQRVDERSVIFQKSPKKTFHPFFSKQIE